MASEARGMTRKHQLLFWPILVLIVVLVPSLLLEVGVRLGAMRVSNDMFLQFGRVNSFFTKLTVDGRDFYQVASRDVYRERNTTFAAVKDPGTFRIFCLGGSASAGWPHPPEQIYSAYLAQALQQVYPARKVEVINVGAHAYSAYRVRLIFDEIIEFAPDLIIIYSGNNEFLERRAYQVEPRWYDPFARLLNLSVAYRVLRGSVIGRRLFPENTLSDSERDHVAYDLWSKVQRLPLALRQDRQQFERVQTHYALSIESMAADAGKSGVPVLLLTVPVNLRDWAPNASVNSNAPTESLRWRADYVAGRGALLRNDTTTAVAKLQRAAEAEPEHADSHFYLARALEVARDLPASARHYSMARDLDRNPNRASSAFNESVRRTAEKYAHVQLVDADAVFRAASAPFSPGFDLFLDYVHPTVRGNRILAAEVFDAIVRQKYIGEIPAVVSFAHRPKTDDGVRGAYQDASDYDMQRTLLMLLVVNQYEPAALKARSLARAEGALAVLGPEKAKVVLDALAVFPEVVDAERRRLLGEDVAAPAAALGSKLEAFFGTTFPSYAKFVRQLPEGEQRGSREFLSRYLLLAADPRQ